MRIEKGDLVAGLPAIAVRNFLRKYVEGESFNVFAAELRLKMNEQEAGRFVGELETLGLIERSRNQYGRDRKYLTTIKGNALAHASAAKPILRSTAERTLEDFLGRARNVNASRDYVYRVKSIVIFGSFLTDQPTVNDVDVAVELVPRIADPKKLDELRDQRASLAEATGRKFGNFIMRLDWARQEVLLALKNRSRTISLHAFEPFTTMGGVTFRVLMGDKNRIRALVKQGRMVK